MTINFGLVLLTTVAWIIATVGWFKCRAVLKTIATQKDKETLLRGEISQLCQALRDAKSEAKAWQHDYKTLHKEFISTLEQLKVLTRAGTICETTPVSKNKTEPGCDKDIGG